MSEILSARDKHLFIRKVTGALKDDELFKSRFYDTWTNIAMDLDISMDTIKTWKSESLNTAEKLRLVVEAYVQGSPKGNAGLLEEICNALIGNKLVDAANKLQKAFALESRDEHDQKSQAETNVQRQGTQEGRGTEVQVAMVAPQIRHIQEEEESEDEYSLT